MLRNLGFAAVPLHGQLPQAKRLGALNKFKAGTRNILVATDVASRGIDIPMVDVVINYDVPQSSKDYIHRVGRTARAGRSGKSVTFVTQYDVELIQRIEKDLERKLDVFPVEKDEVMMLQERVDEAQRIATIELKETENGKKSKRGGRRNEDDDDDADVDQEERGGAQGKRKYKGGNSNKSNKRR
jgi:ATP-dependent RNA helicase DDX47/RRP3